MHETEVPFLIGWFLGIAIALAGWTAAAVVGIIALNRRVRRMELEHPEELSAPVPSALLFYALSLLFWPAAFITGAYLLQRTPTAAQGRVCVLIGIGNISVITLLTCLAMAIAPFFLSMPF